MKKMFALLVIGLGAGMIAASAGAGNNTALPFSDNFEVYTNATPLNTGTNGWHGSSSSIIVVSNNLVAPAGSTNIAMIPVYCTLSNRFEGIPSSKVYLQMNVRPDLYERANPPAVNANLAIMFYVNTNGNFVVHKGPASPAANWVTATNFTIGTKGTNWVTIGIYEDYNTRTWDLYANNALVTNSIGFINTNLTSFTGFDVYNGAQTSYLDNVSVIDGWAGAIELSAPALSYAATYGSSPGNQTLTMMSLGPVGFTYTNTVTYGSGGAGWLAVTPATGEIMSGGTQVLAVAVSSASLTAGVYVATNTITSSATNSPQIFVTTLTVNKKALTVANAVAQNKVYDGNTVAQIAGATLAGVVGADDVALANATNGAFAQANVGMAIAISTAPMTIAGADVGNYTLTQPGGLQADIGAKELTVTGATAQNKVYDGNTVAQIAGATLAGVVGADDVALANATNGAFAQANVGAAIAVATTPMTIAGADIGNYTLTQPIGLHADITMAYEPYCYSNGFEGGTAGVLFWTAGGKTYTENQRGITTNKAHSGAQSYVIDVTFGTATYIYYYINASNVPCENNLKFYGSFLVESVVGAPSSTYGGLGADVWFPPAGHSGCGAFSYSAFPAGESDWKVIDGYDIVSWGNADADNMIPRFVWGATGDMVGRKIDCIGIFLYGSPGDRIRIYIDDIKLEGTVPTATSYGMEVSNRWAYYGNKFDATMSAFYNSSTNAQYAIDTLPGDLSAYDVALQTHAQAALTSLTDTYNLTTIGNRGYFLATGGGAEYYGIRDQLLQANGMCERIYRRREAEAAGATHLFYNVRPTTRDIRYVLPDATNYIPSYADQNVVIITTPGEYEPHSVALEALTNLTDVCVEISDLTNVAAQTLPSSTIDIRVVKCWYQSDIDSVSCVRKILVPDLLLKDDSLIQVGYVSLTNGENYAKVNGSYVWISDPTKPSTNPCPAIANFPIQDSTALLPVDIPQDTFKQFWLTVYAPTGTVAGDYTGYLTFTNAEWGIIGSYPVTVEVLPFELEPSPLTGSLYYRSMLAATGTIGSNQKNMEQYTNELRNLVAHGIMNPNCFESTQQLASALSLRQNAGINDKSLYYLGVGSVAYPSPAQLTALKDQVRGVTNIAAGYGITNVCFYGVDESFGDRLLSEREGWDAIHEAGGKVFSAGWNGCVELARQYPYGKCARWHFDETTGMVIAADSSGNRLDGIVKGGAGWTTNGVMGGALAFDGVDDRVDCPLYTNFDFGTGNFTIEAWVYITNLPSGRKAIVNKGACGAIGYGIELYNGQLCADIQASNGADQSVYSSATTLTTGKWSHCTAVFKRNDKIYVYVDGTNGVSADYSAGNANSVNNTNYLRIGCYTLGNTNQTWYFPGCIDEVSLYSRALNSNEVYKNYQDGLNGKWTTVGDLKDGHVAPSSLNSNLASQCHQVAGHWIFHYDDPQCGVENPQIYRRTYGLRLWKFGYDGPMDYAYQHSFGFIWNDFDTTGYRDHVCVLPTANGVVDTIAWEGVREGIDDMRYLATLIAAINSLPSSSAKDAAIAFVNSLKGTDLEDDWLSADWETTVRDEIIYRILTLLSL